MFDPQRSTGTSFIEDISYDIIYPYLADYRAQITIEIEQGLLERCIDWTGIHSLFGRKEREQFFFFNQPQKVYYPRGDSNVVVELRVKLSSKAHIYK